VFKGLMTRRLTEQKGKLCP